MERNRELSGPRNSDRLLRWIPTSEWRSIGIMQKRKKYPAELKCPRGTAGASRRADDGGAVVALQDDPIANWKKPLVDVFSDHQQRREARQELTIA